MCAASVKIERMGLISEGNIQINVGVHSVDFDRNVSARPWGSERTEKL